ncbi:polysaccharide biosynthesis C-terminal domain-containing protein [Nocardioides sp. B-3]|uniref:polysaccharide biosynthesis C-terminal domain-containing protein n=1 Tax=Nocardioides sp. B-3 TaxID=2895565 RepID=UPI00215298A6|nr:NAD-dependent epimerase/dehydratase family protein [Nocardioides sp. B-3]UUZ61048.1 NAD-dependent epimerase/dehydratase family protein [Nocardioides sp. B-3]
MRILLTGAEGFLGWHTRCLLHATTDHRVTGIGRGQWGELPAPVADVDAVLHLAGVNRATDEELATGNAQLADDVAAAVRAAGRPVTIVFANSIRVGNGSSYAEGKSRAAETLRAVADEVGGRFVDVMLPNLFGEHGRPAYNSFVASFVAAVIKGESPRHRGSTDRAAARPGRRPLVGGRAHRRRRPGPAGRHADVGPGRLGEPAAVPRHLRPRGDVPDMASALEADLFNTYRAALFPSHYPIVLEPRVDPRGRLVETVRSHGSGGQTFVSTTVPGITRGEHYHLHKIERFAVLSGTARISLRRLFHTETTHFDVTGESPVAIDMPTMWVHNITNTGDTELTTLFWTDSLFDPDNPDTFPVPVAGAAELELTP